LNAKTRALAKRRERERAFEERYYYRGNLKKVKNKVRAVFPRGARLLVLSIQLPRNERKEKKKERERERNSIFCFVRSRNFIIKLFFRFRKAYRELTRSIFLSFSFYHRAFKQIAHRCRESENVSRSVSTAKENCFFLSARV